MCCTVWRCDALCCIELVEVRGAVCVLPSVAVWYIVLRCVAVRSRRCEAPLVCEGLTRVHV